MTTWTYVCEQCQHRESLDAPIWRCPACGGALALDGPNAIASETIATEDRTLWRYEAVLPVAREDARSLGEGLTPLI
ncbi:MAG TPA: threonine synthase, partial [Thermomicrobiales bacterium]